MQKNKIKKKKQVQTGVKIQMHKYKNMNWTDITLDDVEKIFPQGLYISSLLTAKASWERYLQLPDGEQVIIPSEKTLLQVLGEIVLKRLQIKEIESDPTKKKLDKIDYFEGRKAPGG